MNSKFNGRIIHTILIIKLFAICTTTDARKKIERFVNVNSDIYVTASLPDLRHSHHTSLRLDCGHSDNKPQITKAWFGFDHVVKKTSCPEDIDSITDIDATSIYDYTEMVIGWCDVRRGCFLHSAEHGNDNLNLKKFWQICYTCVNRRKYETFLREWKEKNHVKAVGALATLIKEKTEEKVEKVEIEKHLQDFWDQFFADDHSMDEIGSTDLEHLTDIGRIVMEMVLTNITTKEPDADPNEEISNAKVDALFEAMDLVAGRMVYLMSLRSNESSRVTFDIEHSMTVEIVSEYLEENNFQKKVFLDRHVSLSHHAYNHAGPFSSIDNDNGDIEVTDDRKIDENQSDDSINDTTEDEKRNSDRKCNTNKILAASITYKDEDIIRAIGGPSLRSHYIRSIVLFDEKGNPKNNLEFQKNQSVEIVFDIVPGHEYKPESNQSSSSSNQTYQDEDHIYEEEIQCVFWNRETFDWSTDGCEAVYDDKKHIGNIHPKGNSHQNSTVKCKCNHLTNFAVLITLRSARKPLAQLRNEPTFAADWVRLRILTLIGCTASAVALTLSLIFFAILYYQSKKEHKHTRGRVSDRLFINAHFCFNLWVFDVIMIFGIGDEGKDEYVCMAMAMSIHYFLLTTFLWSFIAGYQIYILLVVVFHKSSEESSQMIKYTILGYGAPAIVLIVAYVIDSYVYEGTTYNYQRKTDDSINLGCVMDPNILYIVTFFVPVILMLATNMVMLCIAIARVCHLSPRPQLFSQARGLLSLLFILGGTWITSIIYNNAFPSSIFLLYLTTILNSLQGVFIFIFYVVLGENFRKTTKKMIQSYGNKKATSSMYLDETSKFGKGNAQDTTTGHTSEKSKEFDNTECSEEIDNEGVIIAPYIEDHEKKNLQKENQ